MVGMVFDCEELLGDLTGDEGVGFRRIGSNYFSKFIIHPIKMFHPCHMKVLVVFIYHSDIFRNKLTIIDHDVISSLY